MSLSDLDLVHQAVAAEDARTTPTGGANGAEPTTTESNSASAAISAAPTNAPAASPPHISGAATPDPLAALGLDLSSLSQADRAALAPLIDALRAASEPGAELDIDGILQQLEAADGVADVLEGRLDALLANLGDMEAEVGKADAAGEK